MSQLTDIQKKIYANQTAALELAASQRAAQALLNARKDLLKRVKAQGEVRGYQGAVLGNLEATLQALPKAVTKSLDMDGLLDRGFQQGTELIGESSVRLRGGEKISGFSAVIDLGSLAHEKDKAINQIQGVTDKLKENIKQQIEISLALGEGESETIKRLFSLERDRDSTAPFRTAKHGIERVSRTASNSLVNAGKHQAYSKYAENFPELGIENEWVNVSDFRTSDTCLSLVGQRRKPGEPFSGVGFSGLYPPAHPFCRSTIIPVITGKPAKENTVKTQEVTNVKQVENTKQPGTTGPVALDDQIAKGSQFVRDGLSKPEVQLLERDIKSFKTENEWYQTSGDKETLETLKTYIREVAPIAQKVLDKLKAKTPSNLKTDYASDSRGKSSSDFVRWTNEDGKSVGVELDESLRDHIQAHRMTGLIENAVGVLGGKLLEDAKLVYLDKQLKKTKDRNRGWANADTKTINVGGKTGEALAATMLHEVGHFIEYDREGATQASRELIERRATGPMTYLSEISSNYRDDEVYLPDKFVDPYVGKIYGHHTAGSEVIAMGLQHLVTAERMAQFMLEDPEHFNYALSFIVGD